MENGVNLSPVMSVTKSRVEFGRLLDEAISEVSLKELRVSEELADEASDTFYVGRYVYIGDGPNASLFWIGLGMDENCTQDQSIWLEFDAKNSPSSCWDKVNECVGSSGKYYSDIDLEFAQLYMNAWVHFFLKKEYVLRFFGENTDRDTQKKIITGFLKEVLEKVG
jgi:hypothetical protein